MKTFITFALSAAFALTACTQTPAGEADATPAQEASPQKKSIKIAPDGASDTDPALKAPFIAPGARNQDPSQGKLKGTTIRIKRPLLMVKDLQRSLDFYQDIVGLELYAVEPDYKCDVKGSMGQKLFNTPLNTRRRIASLNTSDEVRGLTLRELPDVDFEIPNNPYIFTLLFESSDILELHDRAVAAGIKVNAPILGIAPATDKSPEIRYMEFSLVDPDGYLLAIFKNFDDVDQAEWDKAVELYGLFYDF